MKNILKLFFSFISIPFHSPLPSEALGVLEIEAKTMEVGVQFALDVGVRASHQHVQSYAKWKKVTDFIHFEQKHTHISGCKIYINVQLL